MSRESDTYEQLYRLREQIKEEGRKANGRAPTVCSDESLHIIAEVRPQTLEDFESIPDIGKTFIEKYGERFLKVIKATETDTTMLSHDMNDRTRSTVEKLENRLVNLNKRNRNLYFPKCQNKKGLDILLPGRGDPRDIIWSGKKTMVVADLVHPAQGYDTEKTVHARFNTLIRENENERRDKGQNVLYLAYPFVKGMIEGENFNVRAPLAYIPVSATRESSKIVIKQDTDREVLYNSTLLMAYCKFTKQRFDADIDEIEDPNPETFVSDILSFYRGRGIEIINEDPDMHPFKNYLQNEFPKFEPGKLYVDNCAILGNLPQFSSTVQLDFQRMLESNQINDLVQELLEDYDDDAAFTSPGEEDVTVDDRDLQVSENDLVYINDLNSSQENVISAIKKEDKLVVKGPPGTGKSQMIASLIADFACNGKTVLLVSEKKTAIDVVHSRLGDLSTYSMMLDDVGSKELFYSTLNRMVAAKVSAQPDYELMNRISAEIDKKVAELQGIANDLYAPDSFGLEPYKLYHLTDKNKEDPERQESVRKVADDKVTGLTYEKMESAHESFSNPSLLNNVRTNMECKEKCPSVAKYPAAMTSAEFAKMTDDLRGLLKEVDDFNHKGFFGKLLGKGKLKKSVNLGVYKAIGKTDAGMTERILQGKDDVICDERTYVDYDTTRSVAEGLSESERTYLQAMQRLGGIDAEVNDELFDSVMEWHLDLFESRHRDVIMKINNFDSLLTSLRDLISKKKDISRRQMQAVLHENLEKMMAGKRGQEIQRKLESKRRWSVNKFVRQFKHELFSYVKIWMMTPEVVSEIVPMQNGMFDLVVFDEASQMFVEKGIPAILRAKKVVVCGDEKQLRPNSVGQRRMSENNDDEFDDDDEAAESAALEEESLLDLARSRYKCVILNFHYRSKFEELIAFSNYGFYNGRLLVAPNVLTPEKPPIEVFKTYDAVWANRSNIVEADKVVEVLKDFFKTRRNNESVGIITFNINQRDLIDDRISEACRQDPEFDRAVAAELQRKDNGEDTGLFVKNIENVQGDERDVIIFSTTYAKNQNGKMIRQFGTLNMDGGENRLNVAVSRAKRKIYVVTSFDPEELYVDDIKGKGPKYFKKYLQYAHAVSDGDTERVRQVLQSFGDTLGSDEMVSFDSEFENEVYDRLREKGLEVHTQVGVGGYRIDLAIKQDGKYILGVECDGRIYHGSKSARERDLHRQNYLESRGWRIHRIWSPNWWRNPDREIEKICEIVNSYGGKKAGA